MTTARTIPEPASRGDRKKPDTSFRRFVRLIASTRPSMTALIAAAVLSIGTTGATLIVPLVLSSVVDGIAGSGTTGVSLPQIGALSSGSFSPSTIVLLVGALLLQAALSAVAMYLLNRSGQRIVARLRDRIWQKLLRLRVSFYDDRESGEVISRVTNDTSVLQSLIAERISGFFTGIISIVGAVSLMIVIDWHMTLTMLAAIPIAAVVMYPIGRIMRKNSIAMQDETASLTAVLSQTVSQIRLVKSSTAEPHEYRRGSGVIERLFRVGLKEGKLNALLSPVMSLAFMALLVLVVGYGGLRVSSGAISAGELVAFILYLIQTIVPITQIATFFTQLQKARGATESIVSILDAHEEPLEYGSLERRLPGQDGSGPAGSAIAFDSVSFSYGAGDPVVSDVSFSVRKGEVTALVGPSGAGKTTLFSLIERFYEPQSGSIVIDGQPIASIPLVEWRERIGYVSQESPAISGTIRENIVYGLEREVDDRDVADAARMAYAADFIESLPDGYETQVGERGVKLSGGQRQRIAIARALLRDPEVLMLDEATSSLDSESERFVQKALDNLMRGRTTLVIAHRLSTVVGADKILFIEGGHLTGAGTHEQLVRTHRTYRRYAEHQLRERRDGDLLDAEASA